MGYTRYFYRPLEIPREYWDMWTQDVRTILANLPAHTATAGGFHQDDPLCVAWECDQPSRPPQVDGTLVRFNGTTPGGASDESDLGHETFYIQRVFDTSGYVHQDERGRYFAFCKTAGKPYDLAVTACLIRLAARMAEGVEVASDGDPEEWEEGRQLCEDLFGFAAVPLKGEAA